MAYRKLLEATGLLAGVFVLTPSFASALEGKVTAGERHELRHDRREIRHDRREIHGDRREVHGDRKEIRGDRRESLRTCAGISRAAPATRRSAMT